MSRTSTLILLGIIVMLTPFSGLPIAIRSLISVICGIAILGIGLMLRTREVHQAQPTETPAPAEEPTIPTSPSSI